MANDRPNLPGEIWKPAVGYEGRYEVSNMGRFWSVRAKVFPKAQVTEKGYLRVGIISDDGHQCSKSIHSMVLTAFVGPRPNGLQTAHLDGNPSNNRLSNLAWVTPKENCSHKKLHGTHRTGAAHWGIKLTDADVDELRRLRREGWTWKELGFCFNVSDNCARRAGLGLDRFSSEGACAPGYLPQYEWG